MVQSGSEAGSHQDAQTCVLNTLVAAASAFAGPPNDCASDTVLSQGSQLCCSAVGHLVQTKSSLLPLTACIGACSHKLITDTVVNDGVDEEGCVPLSHHSLSTGLAGGGIGLPVGSEGACWAGLRAVAISVEARRCHCKTHTRQHHHQGIG